MKKSSFRKTPFLAYISVLTLLTIIGCGKEDAATTAAGTSTVTIQGSGSSN